MCRKIVWLTQRSIFLLLYFLMLLTGGLFAFLLAPLTSYLMFNDWRFWKHIRFYCPLTLFCYRQLGLLITQPAYRKCCTLPMTEPPRTSPSKELVELAATWDTPEIECGECSQCCTKLGCPLIDTETGCCRSYNSFYWRYFNCGRYPATQAQIDYYGCPKWIVKEPGESFNR